MIENNKPLTNDTQAAIEAGRALGAIGRELIYPTTAPFALSVVPTGYQIKEHDLEKFMPAPRRLKQAVVSTHLGSFTRYVNDFKNETTRIFCREKPGGSAAEFLAVLDYHQEDPSWCEHRVKYTPVHSPEYIRWIESNGKKLSQGDFASFLEDNYWNISEPDASTILGLALTFEATKAADFRSGIRLNNGQVQFTYTEEIKTGSVEIPTQFKIGIPIYKDDDQSFITCRLKYRLDSGKLFFFYELVRIEAHLQAALEGMIDNIARITEIQPLIAWPEGF